MNGRQGGDPATLAAALLTLTDSADPPLRWLAGADAVQTAEGKAHDLLARADAHRALSAPATTTTPDARAALLERCPPTAAVRRRGGGSGGGGSWAALTASTSARSPPQSGYVRRRASRSEPCSAISARTAVAPALLLVWSGQWAAGWAST